MFWIIRIDVLDNKKGHCNYLSNLCDMIIDMIISFDIYMILSLICMILSFFWRHFERVKSKRLEYRNYKKFDKNKFLFKLDQILLKDKMEKTQKWCVFYRSVIDKHAQILK